MDRRRAWCESCTWSAASPHTDYQDGYDIPDGDAPGDSAGNQVHTIRCGNDPSTEESWRQVASLGHDGHLTIEAEQRHSQRVPV